MTRFISTVILILQLLLSVNLVAQDITDSLRNEIKKSENDIERIDLMNLLADAMVTRDMRNCLNLCDSILVLSEKVDYSYGAIDAWQTKGFAYAISGRYDQAFEVLEKALEYLESNPHQDRRAAVLYALGIATLENGDFETAEGYFLESHSIKKSQGVPETIVKSLNGLANLYMSVGDYSKTLEALNEELELVETIDNDELKLLPYRGLGTFYSSQGDYAKALEYQLEAERLSETVNDPDSRSKVLFSIGGSYRRLKEHGKALGYYEKCYEIIKDIGQQNFVAITLREMAVAHSKLGNDTKVPVLLKEALKIYQDVNQDCQSIHVYISLSQHYLRKDQLDSAGIYAERAMKMGDQCTDFYLKIVALKIKATWYAAAGKNLSAINLYLDAYQIAEDKNLLNLVRSISLDLSRLYEKDSRYAKALEFHKIFQTTKDSIFNKDNTKKITRLESQFQYEKEKEVMIAEQEKQELILEQKIQRQRIIQMSAFGGLILVLILAITFYRNYQAKKRDHKLLSQRNKKIEMQADELQKTNEQLIELSSFKEGLTHMIAHDMKNPLNVIIGLSENGKKDRHLNDIHQAGKRMLNMVTNMLDIQRFEQAEVELNAENVNLEDLLRSAKHQVELLAHAKAIEIVLNYQSNLKVACNEDMIVRVLVNLLSNAIKYSGFDTRIEISARSKPSEEDDFISISVKDEGEGITEEELPHVFEKFWQVRAKASGDAKSTGLGLTYCKMAVEAHGGEIDVESKRSEGTNFTFTLPASVVSTASVTDHVKIETTTAKQPVILEGEMESLRSYAEHLKKLKVYQASEINNIIDQMDKQELQSIWKEELKVAVYECNTERFNDLVNMI